MTAPVLPDPAPRAFLPEALDLTSLDALTPLFDALLAMDIGDEGGLRAFLSAWNELACATQEAGALGRLHSAQHTDREDYKEAVLHFTRAIEPRLSEWSAALGRRLLGSPALGALEGTAFAPFIRQVRAEVELFREESLPLIQQVEELDQRYGEISGAWLVEIEGRTWTFPALSVLLADPDRAVRQRAWEAFSARLTEDADALDDLWEQMFALRHQIALDAGFENFRDFTFKERLRDYDPEACEAYCALIEAEVVPLIVEIARQRKTRLGLDTYRPWDTSVDPDGLAPLAPFEEVERLFGGVERMMRRLDPVLGAQFGALRDFMDLGNRPNKRQGGFMMTLKQSRRPFIFANATGRHHDIITLLHEAGHAFHTLAQAHGAPMADVQVPMEFNEVASMAMELLHRDTLDEFYGPEDRARAVKEHIARIPNLLCMVAHGQAFQDWLYTHPGHTRAQRHERWLIERDRFLPYVDHEGIDEGWQRTSWHRTLHFFVVPFYFIEYGFAQLGALQIALNAEADPVGALSDYRAALALGATRDTAGLYEAAGASFIPTPERVRALMAWVRDALDL